MAASAFLQSLSVAAAMLLSSCSIGSSQPDTSFVSGGCNIATYTSGDPFEHSLHYLLPILETVTANQPEYDYYTRSPYPESVAYGHALCNTSLVYIDCVTCISYVKEQLVDGCPNSVGAQWVLRDCQMRYEQYPFRNSGGRTGVDRKYWGGLLLFLVVFHLVR